MIADEYSMKMDSMQLELRGYQVSAIDEILKRLSSCGSLVYTLATGGGKTAIAGAVIKHYGRGLFVSPTLSVVQQAPGELGKVGIVARAIGSGLGDVQFNDVKEDTIACTYITGHRHARADDFDVLIVDEAHHACDGESQVTELVNRFRDAGKPVLGITATLWRLGVKESFEGTWEDLIQGPGWKSLKDEGYLAGLKIYAPSNGGYIRGAGRNAGGDYAISDTYKQNRKNVHFTSGAAKLAEQAVSRNKRVLIYAISVDHADEVARLCRERGLATGILVSRETEQRDMAAEKVRDGLKTGELDVVVNVNMVTEGYDCPSVECIIILRPTKSKSLYLQMYGRGSRLDENKEALEVHDLTNNPITHGHPFTEHIWQLGPRGNPATGKFPSLVCPRDDDGENERCPELSAGGWRHCPYCYEPLGHDCPVCKNWRYWKRYEHDDSNIYWQEGKFRKVYLMEYYARLENARVMCSYCVSENLYQYHLEREKTRGMYKVQKSKPAIDKNGKPFLRLFYRENAYVNLFSWHKQFQEIQDAFTLSKDLHIEIATNKQGWPEVKRHHITKTNPSPNPSNQALTDIMDFDTIMLDE